MADDKTKIKEDRKLVAREETYEVADIRQKIWRASQRSAEHYQALRTFA